MGWHSDDEKGLDSTIVSISLGSQRRFCFRHKKQKELKKEYQLKHGSILIMKNNTQKEWKHSLPKQMKITEKRINLTFREIERQI